MLLLSHAHNIFCLSTLIMVSWAFSSVPSIVSVSFKFLFVPSFLIHSFMVKCCYSFIFRVRFYKVYWKLCVLGWGLASGAAYFLQRRVLQSFASMYEPGWQHPELGGKECWGGFSSQWFLFNPSFPFSVWHLHLYLLHSRWPKFRVLLFSFSGDYTSRTLGRGRVGGIDHYEAIWAWRVSGPLHLVFWSTWRLTEPV